MKKNIILFSGWILLALIHVFLGSKAITALSPTYDEPVHATAGYIYLKTSDYRYNGHHHPPFAEMWAAVPWLVLKPILPIYHTAWMKQTWNPYEQYQFADLLIYRNRVSHEKLLSAARRMQLLMSVLLGLALLLVGWSVGGPGAGFLSAAFWSMSPTFLAQGTLVTTDLAFAVFFFLFFYGLTREQNVKWSIFSGTALGLAMASKYLAVAIFPCLFVVGVYFLFQKKYRHGWFKKNTKAMITIPLAALFVLILIYQGSSLNVFWEGFSSILTRAQAGRTSFFKGEYSNTGWLTYFPFAFLVKTPIPVLIALSVAVGVLIMTRMSVSPWLIIPPVMMFGLACISNVQIGHRHILAIYPFLFSIVGFGLNNLGKRILFVVPPLLLWLFLEVWHVKPFYLSYFNQFVGGPSEGYRYFTDSNLDWGQGLKMLAQELEKEDLEKGIYLSYFGVADPHSYGIRYINVGSDAIADHKDDRGNLLEPPNKFAISVTNYQATYYSNREVFGWLKDKKPLKKIGYSIFLYDFKNDPDSLKRLNALTAMPFERWNK